jgi:cytochrome o ubiquinol oxidase subunit I
VSIRNRDKLRDVTGDPWNGRTLEWATASPPPAWNFAFQPKVAGLDAFWSSKNRAQATKDEPTPTRKYESVEMPKNSATGFVTAFFAVVIGFAMIWHIWWLASVGLLGAFVTLLAFSFRRHGEIEVPAEQIARFERTRQAGVAA